MQSGAMPAQDRVTQNREISDFFCYCGEENMSSCDLVLRDVKIYVLLFD